MKWPTVLLNQFVVSSLIAMAPIVALCEQDTDGTLCVTAAPVIPLDLKAPAITVRYHLSGGTSNMELYLPRKENEWAGYGEVAILFDGVPATRLVELTLPGLFMGQNTSLRDAPSDAECTAVEGVTKPL